MNEAETFARTGKPYLGLIHPVTECDAYHREVAFVVALSSSVPDELVCNLIVGPSWRQQLLGLCFALARNSVTFTDAIVKSFLDLRGISVVPTCAARVVMARRGLFAMTAWLTTTTDRSAFDSEVGWAVDKAMHFAGIRPEDSTGKGPNCGQAFEGHTEVYEWVPDGSQG